MAWNALEWQAIEAVGTWVAAGLGGLAALFLYRSSQRGADANIRLAEIEERRQSAEYDVRDARLFRIIDGLMVECFVFNRGYTDSAVHHALLEVERPRDGADPERTMYHLDAVEFVPHEPTISTGRVGTYAPAVL